MIGCWYDCWLVYYLTYCENNCVGVDMTGSVNEFGWEMLVNKVIVGFDIAVVD